MHEGGGIGEEHEKMNKGRVNGRKKIKLNGHWRKWKRFFFKEEMQKHWKKNEIIGTKKKKIIVYAHRSQRRILECS